MFGDQPANGLEAERRGYGVSIPLPDLTSEKLFEAVTKILTDPKYTSKAQEHGQLVMDELTTPLERAIWWIEYAIRYPGTYGVRNLEMTIRFSLKSRSSERFHRPEMSQIKAEISLRTNVKLNFHKNVGCQ